MAVAKSRKQKIHQKNLDLHRNQVRLNRVLAVLGVTELHKKLHANLRQFILENPDPPLVQECPDGVKPGSLFKRLEEWKGLSYRGISASDFTEVMFPLIRHIGSSVGDRLMAESEDRQFKRIPKTLFTSYVTPANEFLRYFMDQMTAVLQLTVWEETAPDRQYVKMEIETEKLSRNRIRFKVVVNVDPISRVWSSGGWKYRVGARYDGFFNLLPETVWLSKCPLDYGLPGRVSAKLPVFISGHALERIRERLDDQWVRMVAMFAIYSAMDKPVYYHLDDGSGDMLVELRVKEPDLRLGYLVVSRTEKEIIIKTFLFCTMFQTPEGGKLHRRLRMARPDFDFHKLENYSTLAHSDLTTHPKLRPLWNECGFGGLLKLIDNGTRVFGLPKKERAEDLIQYFRLG